MLPDDPAVPLLTDGAGCAPGIPVGPARAVVETVDEGRGVAHVEVVTQGMTEPRDVHDPGNRSTGFTGWCFRCRCIRGCGDDSRWRTRRQAGRRERPPGLRCEPR